MHYLNEKTLEIRVSQDCDGKYGCDIVHPDTGELIFGWDPEFDTAAEAVAAAVVREETGLCGARLPEAAVSLFERPDSDDLRLRIGECVSDGDPDYEVLREAVSNMVSGDSVDLRGVVHLDDEGWAMFKAVVNDYRIFGETAGLRRLAEKCSCGHSPCCP